MKNYKEQGRPQKGNKNGQELLLFLASAFCCLFVHCGGRFLDFSASEGFGKKNLLWKKLHSKTGELVPLTQQSQQNF
jgi:hypothetical protein